MRSIKLRPLGRRIQKNGYWLFYGIPRLRPSSEQCVVFAHAYIFTGVMLRAALPHNDITRDATLATKNFDAEPFRFRLASVFRTSYTFFMCHYSSVFFVLAAAGFFAAGFFAAGALAAGFSAVAFLAPPALMPVILISVNEARKPFNFW